MRKGIKSYTIPEFYNYYIKNIDNSLYSIEYDTYRDIVEEYFKGIADLVFNGYTFKMPCRLGCMFIMKSRPKTFTRNSLSVDFKTTKELGKTVFYLNDHSCGFKYRFFWSKKEALFTNKCKYQMIMTRANKRKLAQVIFNKEHDYIEL